MPLVRGSSRLVANWLGSGYWALESRCLIGTSTPSSQQPAAAAVPKPAAAPAPGPPAPPAAPALPPHLMQVTVNDVNVVVPKNYSVLQACEAAGIDIPRCVS